MQERKYPLKRQTEDKRDLKFSVTEDIELPSKVDFRSSCPEVYDQGNVGSCTSNAYISLFRMLQQTQGKDINIDYSRLKHYYDERKLEGTIDEDSGASMRDGAKVLKNIGACLEELHPYIESNLTKKPSDEAEIDSAKHKITAYKQLDNLTQIKQYLAKQDKIGKPMGVAIGMEIYSSFESNQVAKTGVVPMPNVNREEMLGGHGVKVVGYDDNFGKTNKTARKHKGFLASIINLLLGNKLSLCEDDGYLIVKNSWNSSWGDHGYFYLPYSFVKKHAYDFWVIE